MGVTIESENHSIDMGYGGFNNLRTKIAELTNKALYDVYRELNDGLHILDEEESKKFWDDYDKKANRVIEENKIPYGVADFLYSSDAGGSCGPEECEEIYEVIKDYDDNVLYGYAGRKDCAMFKDFKTLVKDCIDSNCEMEWF